MRSPAKVNLFLKILRRRSDGYHEIETLFERVSLADTLVLRRLPSGIHLSSDSAELPLDFRNTAYRAAALLTDRFRVRHGVHVHIVKRIPVAAGLGGGSSNAASVLLGLNRLWRLGLSKKTLLSLASQIGSDVPFFVMETPWALGRGRGEILKKIGVKNLKIWHCLVKPDFGISTKDAYHAFRSSALTLPKPNVKMLVHSIQKGDSEALAKLLTNSLEHTLNKRVREILKIKKELVSQGALGSLMSGSGSCVFGVFSSKKLAVGAARRLSASHSRWKTWVVSTY